MLKKFDLENWGIIVKNNNAPKIVKFLEDNKLAPKNYWRGDCQDKNIYQKVNEAYFCSIEKKAPDLIIYELEEFQELYLETITIKPMQKLKEYRVKSEFTALSKALFKECEADKKGGWGRFDVDSNVKDFYQKAGVLDIWFEPAYQEADPEIKISDYIVFLRKFDAMQIGNVGKVVNITSERNSGEWLYYKSSQRSESGNGGFRFNPGRTSYSYYIYGKDYRLAKEAEILGYLIEDFAKKTKCDLGSKISYKVFPLAEERKSKIDQFILFDKLNASLNKNKISACTREWFENNPTERYQLGICGTFGTLSTDCDIKPDKTPDISISGYKAEFKDDCIKFGCQTYTKGEILVIGKFVENSGLDIEEKDSILKIYNYYKNKK